jgi:ABC-type amino acid transport substrate-binding protein
VTHTLAMVAILLSANAPVPAELQSSAPLRVVTNGDYMPMNGFTKKGEPTGLEGDVARGLAKRLGRKVVVISRESLGVSCFDAVAGGKADVALCAVSVPEQAPAGVGFTGLYTAIHYLMLGLTNAFPDDKPFTVAAVSAKAAEAVRQQYFHATPVLVDSSSAGLALLEKGEVRFVVAEDVEVQRLVAADPERLQIVQPAFGRVPLVMAVPKGLEAPYTQMLNYSIDMVKLNRKWRPGEPADEPRALLAWLASCRGTPDPDLAAKACAWFDQRVERNRPRLRKLCQNGNAFACVGLGRASRTTGGPIERNEADRLLRASCKAGHMIACNQLGVQGLEDEFPPGGEPEQ